ncbi:hypothetical protein [Helicobacter sp. 23-1045]
MQKLARFISIDNKFILLLVIFGNGLISLYFTENLRDIVNMLTYDTFYRLEKGVGAGISLTFAYITNAFLMIIFGIVCIVVYKKFYNLQKRFLKYLLIALPVLLGLFALHCYINPRYKLFFFVIDFMIMFLNYFALRCFEFNGFKKYLPLGIISLCGILLLCFDIRVLLFFMRI